MAAKKIIDWTRLADVPSEDLKAILENPAGYTEAQQTAAYWELSARMTAGAMGAAQPATEDEGLAAVLPERPAVLSGVGPNAPGSGVVGGTPDPTQQMIEGLGQRQSDEAWQGVYDVGKGIGNVVGGVVDSAGDAVSGLYSSGVPAYPPTDTGPPVPMDLEGIAAGGAMSAGPLPGRPPFLPGGSMPGSVAGSAAPRPGPMAPMPSTGGRQPEPLPGGTPEQAINAGMSTAAQFAAPSLAAEQESQNAAEQEMRQAAADSTAEDDTNKWLALAIGGAKMASTPGGLLQGDAAGLGAGVEAYKTWQQEALMNRLKQEAAELDRQQLGETGRHNRAVEGMSQAELDAIVADRAAGRGVDERRLALAEETLARSGYVQGVQNGRTVWIHPQTGDIREAPEGFSPAVSGGFDFEGHAKLTQLQEAYKTAESESAIYNSIGVITGYDPVKRQQVLERELAKLGMGGAPPAGQPAPAAPSGGEPTAVNPQTGERLVFRNGQWVPAQ